MKAKPTPPKCVRLMIRQGTAKKLEVMFPGMTINEAVAAVTKRFMEPPPKRRKKSHKTA